MNGQMFLEWIMEKTIFSYTFVHKKFCFEALTRMFFIHKSVKEKESTGEDSKVYLVHYSPSKLGSIYLCTSHICLVTLSVFCLVAEMIFSLEKELEGKREYRVEDDVSVSLWYQERDVTNMIKGWRPDVLRKLCKSLPRAQLLWCSGDRKWY